MVTRPQVELVLCIWVQKTEITEIAWGNLQENHVFLFANHLGLLKFVSLPGEVPKCRLGKAAGNPSMVVKGDLGRAQGASRGAILATLEPPCNTLFGSSNELLGVLSVHTWVA